MSTDIDYFRFLYAKTNQDFTQLADLVLDNYGLILSIGKHAILHHITCIRVGIAQFMGNSLLNSG